MSRIVPNVEELGSPNHRYRKLLAIVNWTELARPLKSTYFGRGHAEGMTSKIYTERLKTAASADTRCRYTVHGIGEVSKFTFKH